MRAKLVNLLTIAICLAFVAAMPVKAAPESADSIYVSEKNYKNQMESNVLPYIEEIKSEGYILGEEGLALHYEQFINPEAKDNIVIIHGISEASEKFYEFIYDLSNQNYNVFLLECRGHGNSERFLDNPSKIDIDSWENVVKDQKTFVELIVKPQMKKDAKLFLYAHSFGGGIGTAYLEMYPEDYDAAILNCPLYGYELGFPYGLLDAVTSGLTLFGRGDEYIPGLGDFRTTVEMETAYSSSEARVYYYNDQRVLDESQHTFSPTNRFFSESCKMIDYSSNKKNIEKISCPVLLISGEKDTAVQNIKHEKVASYSDEIEHVVIAGARHEIYMEADEILFPYLDKVFSFYKEYV